MRIITTYPWIGILTSDLFDQISADQTWRGIGFFNQTISVEIFCRQDGFHGTCQADMLGDCTGIHPFYSHDAMMNQVIGERLISTPIAEDGTVLPDDESFYIRSQGFNIFSIDSIISNKWIGHDDDLTFIRGIGENLLVTSHAGIKNSLPCLFPQKSERPSLKYSPILKGQYSFLFRFHQITLLIPPILPLEKGGVKLIPPFVKGD